MHLYAVVDVFHTFDMYSCAAAAVGEGGAVGCGHRRAAARADGGQPLPPGAGLTNIHPK